MRHRSKPARGLPFRVSNLLAGLALTVALVGNPVAVAADRGTADRLRDVETEVTGLSGRVDGIRVNFTERSGLIGVTEARRRYEDAVYLFLVEDYEPAATSFYIIVQSRALGNAELARDSEWYLAECLFKMENYRTAAEAYKAILNKGAVHPYFPDAVRRLLEVYGIVGDTEAFNQAYTDWILSGKVKTDDLLDYTLAKSFHRRGERGRAKAKFESLAQTSPYWTRARYFLGVLMIQEKNFAQAIVEFKSVEAIPVTTDEHRQVLELAQLALARLYYETGAFADAAGYYRKLGGESPYYADQLYESVWTFIKQGQGAAVTSAEEMVAVKAAEVRNDRVQVEAHRAAAKAAYAVAAGHWSAALEQLDNFLLHFPEHRYTASLKLVQGHLNMKLKAYDKARESYETVIDEYTPVAAKLAVVAGGRSEMRSFLDGMTGGSMMQSAKLPKYAVEMLMSRDDVSRSAAAWREIDRQRGALAENERTVQDLQVALTGETNVLGAFVTARAQLGGIQSTVLSLGDRLLEAEAIWLKSRVPLAVRADLAAIQKDRATALTTLASGTQGAERDSDRYQMYAEQVAEVQQRAFRLAQEAQRSKALADDTMEEIGPRLKQPEAESVRAELVRQQEELTRLLAELDQLQSEVVRRKILRTVESQGNAEDVSQRSAMQVRQSDLRRRLATLRRQVTDPDAAATFAQIDALWSLLEKLDVSSSDTSRIITAAEAREMTAVRTRLAQEAQRVGELRRGVDHESGESGRLAERVMRRGLSDLEREFQGDVIQADKGIVDVYWMRKAEASDEMQFMAEEQSRLLRELDEEYRIIRENLER